MSDFTDFVNGSFRVVRAPIFQPLRPYLCCVCVFRSITSQNFPIHKLSDTYILTSHSTPHSPFLIRLFPLFIALLIISHSESNPAFPPHSQTTHIASFFWRASKSNFQYMNFIAFIHNTFDTLPPLLCVFFFSVPLLRQFPVSCRRSLPSSCLARPSKASSCRYTSCTFLGQGANSRYITARACLSICSHVPFKKVPGELRWILVLRVLN